MTKRNNQTYLRVKSRNKIRATQFKKLDNCSDDFLQVRLHGLNLEEKIDVSTYHMDISRDQLNRIKLILNEG
tara:strand:- start:31 stop:246 length:216 start_codon:yes stop_codon:yes gene_type:complete